MKIALIYPAEKVDKKVLPDCLPMGILYLAAVAEKIYGASVDIYDGRQGEPYPSPSKLNDYDLIGFTSLTMQITHALRIGSEFKKRKYAGKIIFGGPHASVVPDHLIKQSCVDAVFIGESELSFIEYLKYLEGKPHNIERVWIREKDWKFYKGTSFIDNLDSLPFPLREKYGDLPSRIEFVNMTTSRGCPFQCNYCQPTKEILFGKKVRRRSIQNIIDEIQDVIKKYKIKKFSIDDDTFTFLKSYVMEFCDAVKPLNLKWICQSRTDIDRETLITMKNSGCELMIVGAESGSQRMLDLMNKRNTVEKNKEFLKVCNEIGIDTWCNMMVGYPGETEEDMKMSLKFLRETNPTLTNVSQVTPFPGTYLWEKNKDDIIFKEWGDVARHVHKSKFKSLSKKQLMIKNYITLMNKRYKQPISADLVDVSSFPGNLIWKIPYLLRIIVHKEHQLRILLEKYLTEARKGSINSAIKKLKLLSLLCFKYTRAEIYGHIGWLYFHRDFFSQAGRFYKKFLKIYPYDIDVRLKLAETYIKTKKISHAIKELKKCLEISPNYEPANQLLDKISN